MNGQNYGANNLGLPVVLQDGTYTYVYGHARISQTDGSGTQQIVEATRQIRGEAGARQVPRHDIGLANT